jgi:hypothetical protein
MAEDDKRLESILKETSRRDFLKIAITGAAGIAAGLSFPSTAYAGWRKEDIIEYDPWGNPVKVGEKTDVWVDAPGVYSAQQMSQWCWAACVHNVYLMKGHNVSQEDIVRATYGRIVDLPQFAHHMLYNLNRIWTDRSGKKFKSIGELRTGDAGSASFDLKDDNPLIMLSQGHFTVLTSMHYRKFLPQFGGNTILDRVTVFDPWPGRGHRNYSTPEWQSVEFAACVKVEEIEETYR